MVFTSLNKYVFFDRDGTLIRHVHHLRTLEEVEFNSLDGQTVQNLNSLGFKFAIVTNQSVVGRGLATFDEVTKINTFISNHYSSIGIDFEFIAMCIHTESEECDCRKPKVGLVADLLNSNSVDFSLSFVIGDRVSDLLFGKSLGARTILIDSSGQREHADATFVCRSLEDACKLLYSLCHEY